MRREPKRDGNSAVAGTGKTRFGFRAWLLVIVGLGVVVRAVLDAQLADYVLLRVPLVDAQENLEWAARLAAGGTEPRDVYYKPPLYPHVLAWALRLTGPRVDTAYWLNHLLGLGIIVAIAFWMRRFASQRAALWTAAVAAIYGPFLYYEVQALPTILGLALAIASLLLLTQRVGDGTNGRPAAAWRRWPWRDVLTGITLGALALVRPSYLLWGIMVWIWLAADRRRARSALLVALATMLTILPVTWRNRVRGGEWVLISANGGINFFLGNNANWQQTWLLRPGLAWEDLVRDIPPSERRGQARWDRAFARRAAAWVREDPLAFVSALGRKTLHYTGHVELDRNLDMRGFRRQSSVLRFSPRYAWLAPFLFLGLVLAWRRGSFGRLAVLFWISGLVSTVPIFFSERYRVDVALATIACAILGLGEVWALLRRRSTLGPWPVVTLVIAASVLAFGDWGKVGTARGPQAATLEGMAYYGEGNLERAIESLQRAIRADPADADAHYQLATALQKQNRTADAMREYEAAAALVPGNPKPPMAIGWLLAQDGRREEALLHYERAAQVDSTNSIVHLETARLLEALGRRDPARSHFALARRHAPEAGLRLEAERGLERLR